MINLVLADIFRENHSSKLQRQKRRTFQNSGYLLGKQIQHNNFNEYEA
jgi:hypothetical protein